MWCSYLIAIWLGYLLGKWIFGNHNLYHGPNSKDIVNTIFKADGEYWRFTPEVVICPLDTSFIPQMRSNSKVED